MERLNPKGLAVKISKKQAAIMQIEAAIRLLREGDLVSCISLARAAEGSMPTADGGELWSQIKDVFDQAPAAAASADKAHEFYNAPANWLKHSGNEKTAEPEFEFSLTESRINVWMAIAKFAKTYGKSELTELMESFMRKDWQDAQPS